MARQAKAGKVIKLLGKANREAQVEDAYMKIIGANELVRPFGCDGISNDILFEFKLDGKLDNAAGITAIAQATYYVHHIVTNGVYKNEIYSPPKFIAICDKTQAIVLPAILLKPFIYDEQYDWKRPASSPDKTLVNAIHEAFNNVVVYDMTTETGIETFKDAVLCNDVDAVQQEITHENFDRIFVEWKRIFASDKNPQEAALAFLLDLQLQGIKDDASGRIILRCEYVVGDVTKYVDIRVPLSKYQSFWDVYKRPPSNIEMAKIIERKDRLVVMQMRKETGEYFTPLAYAKLAHDYLAKVIPDRYEGNGVHHSMYDDYNWWDPCCGTGNLTLDCPPTMQGKLFMSTLNQEDIDVICNAGQNPNAMIFRYDFLNQCDLELPEELQMALVDEKPWIFILNPPYATGTEMAATVGSDKNTKAGRSKTVIGDRMRKLKMGAACQNTMGQFAFRISELSSVYNIETNIGLFSGGILWTGSGMDKFGEKFRNGLEPRGGFCFHCSTFEGTNGNWPVVYTNWSSGTSDSKVVVDILDSNMAIIGKKEFSPSKNKMSKWVDRPKNTIVMPAMNKALGIVEKDTVRLDKGVPDSIGYALQIANNVCQSVTQCYILSGPHESGNGWSITPDNFEQSMVCFASRKLVIQTWLNDRDEFSVPDFNNDKYAQFAIDATIWSLFDGSNQTSSLGNIIYKNEEYDIPNHFFWMTPQKMMNIEGLPRQIWQQCRTAKPRFVSTWINDNRDRFSADVKDLLTVSEELVSMSASLRMDAMPKFQLDRWDAGWYQVKMGLFGKKDVPFVQPNEMMKLMENFKEKHKSIGDRLRPMLYELGILPRTMLVSV